MKILVTGFEPFNGATVNPSQEIVHLLKAPEGVTLIKAILPVEFQNASAQLRQLLQTHRPDTVLSIGQAGGREGISIERVAINIDCVKSSNGSKLLPDNAGHTPVDAPIHPEGPAAYFSTLPLWEIAEAIQGCNIPAGISNSAGTYVCNHLMYECLHQAAVHYPEMKAGFIHVPFLPEQIVCKANRHAMPLPEMVLGLQAALRVLAKRR